MEVKASNPKLLHRLFPLEPNEQYDMSVFVSNIYRVRIVMCVSLKGSSSGTDRKGACGTRDKERYREFILPS